MPEHPSNSGPRHTNPEALSRFRSKRALPPDPQRLSEGVLKGDRTALSQAITLAESTLPEHLPLAATLLEACMPHTGRSLRLGITGVPGAGKSTFIEYFGSMLCEMGKKVAVLAVDPSSSITKGSILGDKTRMEKLVNHPNAFIRPSPAGDSLGGVARKTREAIFICEAAGFDVIIIETVGVGQSETAVHSMTDFFLLLKLSGAGDELQGIKRGIIEMADAIVINKADGDNLIRARKARTEFTRALQLYPPKPGGWMPKVLLASALAGTGIGEVWQTIEEFTVQQQGSGLFQEKRRQQNSKWLLQHLEGMLRDDFFRNPEVQTALEAALKAVEQGQKSAFSAAYALMELRKSKCK